MPNSATKPTFNALHHGGNQRDDTEQRDQKNHPHDNFIVRHLRSSAARVHSSCRFSSSSAVSLVTNRLPVVQ